MSSQQPQQHMGTAFRPAKTSPASWDAFSDVDAFVDAVLTGPWRQMAPPLQAAVDRSGAAQHGDLVRRVLRHAMAGDWPAIPFGTLDPAWAVAPAAQPLDPGLAAGLRRYSGTQRRHHRQCRSAPTCF